MRKNRTIFVVLMITFYSCGKTTEINKMNKTQPDSMSQEKLLDHVRLAINPKFENWVLFENGTYIIFDNADTISDLEKEAIKQMTEYGPVHAGGPAGDFAVTHLNKTEGWVVSGHGYGMYTYVNPIELKSNPSDVDIGLYGRSKRDKDGKDPIIIHVNK